MRLATAPPHHRTTAPLAGVLLFLAGVIYSSKAFCFLLTVADNQRIVLIIYESIEAIQEELLKNDKRFRPVTTHVLITASSGRAQLRQVDP